MSAETIAVSSDHAGFALKEVLKQELTNGGYTVLDLGTNNEESVDYPDFGTALADAVADGRASRGVAVCGSGIGICIAVNRHPGVRGALCHDNLGARMSRLHNDANVLVLGGRVIGVDVAKDCLQVFLNTDFEGARHARRVEKLG
jgi:ribose 5-phosphate isomerase B